MDISGYVALKNNTKPKGVADNMLHTFQGGQICIVMEFDNDDSGALVLNPEGSALGMFDKDDFLASFKCIQVGNIIMSTSLKDDMLAQMSYTSQVLSRKGGYNDTLKKMIIVQSLNKGEFDDSILWQKQ
jgi:hypothetical protein